MTRLRAVNNLTEADGAPTKARVALADGLHKQLAGLLLSAVDGLAKTDLAKLNESAKKLGVADLPVPAPKKKSP